MPDAGGPLWNVGSGWGYTPYAAVTQGNARRLAGLGGPASTDAPAIANAAATATTQILQHLRTQPAELRGRILRAMADRIRPGGGHALEADAAARMATGVQAPEALAGALSVFLEAAFKDAQAGRGLPGWAAPSGLGAADDWDIAGKLIDKGVSALTNLASTGACIAGVDKLCPYKGPGTVSTTNVYGQEAKGMPGWVLPVAIVGGVLVLGLIGVVALKR